MSVAPCIGCPKVGCGSYHDICPKYQDFRKGQLKSYEERIVNHNRLHDANEIEKRRFDRARKNSPRKQR